VRLVCANIEHLITGGLDDWPARDDRCDVIDVRKCSQLLAVTKNCHRLPPQQLVEEYPDYVPVWIKKILARAIDVMGAKHDKVHAKHPLRCFQV
jgi:hypothetical protein